MSSQDPPVLWYSQIHDCFSDFLAATDERHHTDNSPSEFRSRRSGVKTARKKKSKTK